MGPPSQPLFSGDMYPGEVLIVPPEDSSSYSDKQCPCLLQLKDILSSTISFGAPV